MTRDQARRAALKLAIAHFQCRADVSPAIFDGFLHRETERFLGVPVTPYRAPRAPRRPRAEPAGAPSGLQPAEAMSELERLLQSSNREKS